MIKFAWMVVFGYFAAFFLVVDLTNHSDWAFAGWMISCGMIGYYAKKVIDQRRDFLKEENNDAD